jgi:hypothetical protein
MPRKPVRRAIRLEEALAALNDAEQILYQVENSDVFQAFTSMERSQYYEALAKLHDLIRDLSLDTYREQLAS